MTQISIYLKEIEKESKRNALIRDRRKRVFSEDDNPYNTEIARMTAHLDRRIDRTTRNKWYALSCRIQNADAGHLDILRNGLEKTKNEIRKERKIKIELRKRGQNTVFNGEEYEPKGAGDYDYIKHVRLDCTDGSGIFKH